MLRENAAQAAQVLTMTSEGKDLLDTFLQDFFWEREEGFCRKLPEGYGVRALALRSTTNVVDTLKSIIDIRQACLAALYPDKPSRELLLRELDTDESTACYHFMFQKRLGDDSHWRQEQEATYRKSAKKWKPFNTYVQRVYGGKHLVHALFQAGLSWLPDTEGGISPQDALTRFLDLLKIILEAKKSHTEDPDTQRARKDSGNHRGHSFHGTERGNLLDANRTTLLCLLQGERLHGQMADARAEDEARGQNLRNGWGPKALVLWYDWGPDQMQLWHDYSAGALANLYN